MNYSKKLLSIGVIGFLLLGCAEQKPTPTVEPKKELTEQEKKYEQVVNKTINDCKEQGVKLDRDRIKKFVGRFSPANINKIVTITKKIPKSNCEIFADETSLEKEEKVKVAVTKTINDCKTLGVELDKKALKEHISKIPLFVIKKVLDANKTATKAECEKMKSILKVENE